GRELLVCAVLANLFHAAMQVADHTLGTYHLFPVQLEDHAQHAVRRGVLRPHVEHEFGAVEESRFRHDYCPLSMPRFSLTQRSSCCTMDISFRSGKPSHSSGNRMRRMSGCPANWIPNISNTSRSSQLAPA